MNLTCICFGTLFLLAGVAVALGLVHPHMKMWQEMPQREREKINVGPLCRNVGGFIALSGVLFLMAGVFSWFFGTFFVLSMLAWLIAAFLDLRHISKSDKYINP